MVEADTACSIVDPHLAVIIDDDAKVRQFMETPLTQLGMRVESFAAAKESFVSIDGCHPAIIFLDVALLRSDAIDVLRGLEERRYAGVVQLMSGGRPSLLDAIQRIGVRQGVKLAVPLSKPFTREAIEQVVRGLRLPDTPAPDHQALPRSPAATGR
jgi:DNA-binding NtrC family response regulator